MFGPASKHPRGEESAFSSGHRVQTLSLKRYLHLQSSRLYHSHTQDQFQENSKQPAFLPTHPISLHWATEEQKPLLPTVK